MIISFWIEPLMRIVTKTAEAVEEKDDGRKKWRLMLSSRNTTGESNPFRLLITPIYQTNLPSVHIYFVFLLK